MFYRRFATFLLSLSALCAAVSFSATAQEPTFFTPIAQQADWGRFWIKGMDGHDWLWPDLLAKAQEKGRVIVHLWAPNCPPCVKEIKELDAALPALRAKGIEVLALAQDYNGTVSVPAFARRHGLNLLPLYIDTDKEAWKRSHARGLPVSLLLDAQGRAIALHEGALDWAALGR